MSLSLDQTLRHQQKRRTFKPARETGQLSAPPPDRPLPSTQSRQERTRPWGRALGKSLGYSEATYSTLLEPAPWRNFAIPEPTGILFRLERWASQANDEETISPEILLKEIFRVCRSALLSAYTQNQSR